MSVILAISAFVLAHLPMLAAALYGAQGIIYFCAFVAYRLGHHVLWPYLASALVHGAMFACHYWMGH